MHVVIVNMQIAVHSARTVFTRIRGVSSISEDVLIVAKVRSVKCQEQHLHICICGSREKRYVPLGRENSLGT